jgi:uncharacterized membrane protein YbhN (UPF0104 family)
VPSGFAIGLWVSTKGRHVTLRGVAVLHELARRPVHHAPAWLGAAAYWALDIAAFYGALRFIGLSLSVGETVLAFATGYALTRRSLPLGGAGVTEALMAFSLHWVGLPIPAALAAVVVYRLLNLVPPTIPALMVRPRVKPLVDAAEEGRTAPVHARALAR